MIVTVFCVETRRSSTENNGKRPDARKIGTQKLLPRIRARHISTVADTATAAIYASHGVIVSSTTSNFGFLSTKELL